jgi:hypothetical protein
VKDGGFVKKDSSVVDGAGERDFLRVEVIET